MVQKLVSDLFKKNQHWAYLCINSHLVCFYFIYKSRTTKIYWNQDADHLFLIHLTFF